MCGLRGSWMGKREAGVNYSLVETQFNKSPRGEKSAALTLAEESTSPDGP